MLIGKFRSNLPKLQELTVLIYFHFDFYNLKFLFIGQKPFKCPRCPVTFSTKSNRERHLIRKHGVNMLDPLSRQTMDRPYKCHLCVFSSFSTQGRQKFGMKILNKNKNEGFI